MRGLFLLACRNAIIYCLQNVFFFTKKSFTYIYKPLQHHISYHDLFSLPGFLVLHKKIDCLNSFFYIMHPQNTGPVH